MVSIHFTIYQIFDLTMFDSIVKLLETKIPSTIAQISRKDFESWDRENLFDQIKGVRYGHSFSNNFGIKDYILEFEKDESLCRNYIIKTYVRG